ncbi:MAG TPA: hypothetical protein VGB24_14210 [Longimicrobium sp.]|jgi:hypothetical protein|uniref:hypothetical protein n=1 Tax=Longimicrobium sp. TaxID=2029185 RepID=UPI002ED98612
MKIWKEGEASSTLCPNCERRRAVVFQRRTVELKDPDISIPDVLAAVCSECDTIALIPAQSTPRLGMAVKQATVTLNARIPGHLEDVLLLLAKTLASTSPPSAPAVLRFLLSEFVSNPLVAKRVKERAGDELVNGRADHELSVRIPALLLIEMDEAAAKVGIPSRTAVVKGLLALAKEDILDGRDEVLGNTMRRVLAAVT